MKSSGVLKLTYWERLRKSAIVRKQLVSSSSRNQGAQEKGVFKVPFLLRLKFLRALIAHYIGDNISIRNGPTQTDPSLPNSEDTFLKTKRKANHSTITIGTAMGYVPDGARSDIVKNEFTSITPENALKWGCLLKEGFLGAYDFSVADQMVDYAKTANMRIRGHALIWGKLPGMGFPRNLQEVLNGDKKPKVKLQQIIEEHLDTVLSHYRGRISVWDVVNEPFELSGARLDGNIFLHHLGLEYIDKSFNCASSMDSSLRLVLNEQLDDYGGPRARGFLSLLVDLMRRSVPVHTIGIQSHILFGLPSIEDLRLFLRRIAGLGLSFEITEFDLRIGLFKHAKNPYQAQADYARRLFEVFMEFPDFLGFTFWSCFDSDNWMDKTMPFSLLKPNSTSLYDAKLVRKPLYYSIASLLEK